MFTIAKTSNLFGQMCNGHTARVFRHISRPPSSKTHGQEPRFNPLGIEMLPYRLHRQIFGTNETDELWRHHDGPSRDNLRKCIQHLRRHDLLPEQLSEVDTVYEYHKYLSAEPRVNHGDREFLSNPYNSKIDIPKLEGENIHQHFQTLGDKYSTTYKQMACDIIDKGDRIIGKMPEQWSRSSGWTRYEPTEDGTFKITSVKHPLERTFIFDVETCMNDTIEHAPTIAVALSDKAWYSWTSPRLYDSIKKSFQETSLTKRDLIEFESSTSDERLVIGHNVGFDRSFLSDQYDLNASKTKFLDTMSLHMCICGLTGLQRAVKVSQKRKLEEKSDADLDDIEVSPWIGRSSLNNLADVHEFHCGKKLSKDDREIFVEGTMDDIRDNYQSLMTYCAKDVEATFNVFKKLFPTFSDRFPHPVTLAGMLEMSTMYLPTYVSKWSKYVETSQSAYREFQQQLSTALQELANNACSMTDEEYSKDVWLWDADWSKQTIKPNKSKLLAWQKFQQGREASGDISVEQRVQDIYDSKSFMRQVEPFLPGFPKWYRDLCCPIKKAHALLGDKEWNPGPCLISPQMRITPKLMRLTWNGYPLHHHIKHGWGYLVPNGDLLAGHVELSDDHPYKKFPINELRRLCQDLPGSPLIMTEDLREDLTQSKIDDLKDNTQMSSPNIIRMLKKFSKKKKISPRFKGEYCEDVDIPGAYFIRLPHKNGTNFNVGNPLGREFVAKMEDGTLSSLDNNLANLILKQSLSLSYWKNNHKRITGQMVVKLSDNGSDLGAILPRVVVAGTVTRRAVEPTWLTASNQDTTRVGSELKAMIQSPPGYCFVGADVDSQELWIASLMGDSYSYKIHGGTGLSYMTLRGSKSAKTDMHSKTASLIGITRDDAKVLNYARIYGAGQKFIERFLMNTNPNLSAEQAKEKAKTIFKETKGERKFRSKIYWEGGTESATFNKLEEIASSPQPRTPVLDCQISQALEPEQDQAKDFVTSRVNWVVQSSAVDFLHLLLVNMKWLFEYLNIDGRFAISIHDEVRYLVKEEDKYKAAFALQVSNLLVRSYFSYKLNMKDLPISVAFFSSVDIDRCLRKEVNMDCKSPSNPDGLFKTYNIPNGESLDIKETLRKYVGST